MLIRNTKSQYGVVAQLIHWVTAGLFAYMLYLGFTMVDMKYSPAMFEKYGLHKSLGATILAIAVLRLVWRLVNPSPALPDDTPKHEKLAAHGAHFLLYLLLFALPLSGWVMSSALGFPVEPFGQFKLPNLVEPDKALGELMKEVHFYLVWTFIVVASLHILGALKHHFIDKNNILKRMLIPAKKLLVVGLLVTPMPSLAAQEWQVDKEKSTVGFEAGWSGSPVAGKIKSYKAEIKFSPDDLEGSSAKIELDTSSIDTEYPERDEAIVGTDWFDSAKFPAATFESTAFKYIGGAEYEITGNLTIRDITKEVTFPFEFTTDTDGTSRAKGELTLKRLDFGIGQGEWQATDYVADEVKVIVDLHANPESGK